MCVHSPVDVTLEDDGSVEDSFDEEEPGVSGAEEAGEEDGEAEEAGAEEAGAEEAGVEDEGSEEVAGLPCARLSFIAPNVVPLWVVHTGI